MPGFNWDGNPEFVERLTELWNDGMSVGNISKALGNGITRCGVIGKAHRLNLVSHAKNPIPRPLIPKMTKPKPKIIPPVPPPEKPKPVLSPETFGTDRQCKHIEGDPCEPGWIMCGNPVKKDKPYCEYHHSRNTDLVRTAQTRAAQH